MAMIDLPTAPGPVAVEWRLIDFGGVQDALLGGPSQRINRPGARWAIDVQLPAMHPAMARRWSAALVLAAQHGARWKLRQVGLMPRGMGAGIIAGADQAGAMLAVENLAPGAVWMAGQFLSVPVAGGTARQLYQTASAGAADAAGDAVIALTTPLRDAPDDGGALSFAPSIEGWLGGEQVGWTIDAARHGRMGFSIEEAA